MQHLNIDQHLNFKKLYFIEYSHPAALSIYVFIFFKFALKIVDLASASFQLISTFLCLFNVDYSFLYLKIVEIQHIQDKQFEVGLIHGFQILVLKLCGHLTIEY